MGTGYSCYFCVPQKSPTVLGRNVGKHSTKCSAVSILFKVMVDAILFFYLFSDFR